MIILMSEFLLKLPLFEGAYNVLTYFSVKVICGIAISTLYMLITVSLLEKKTGILNVIIMMPLICVTVYVGDLNGSVSQHWIFYTVRQIYLAGFVLYYFIWYAYSKDKEFKMRIRAYRFLFIISGIFSVLIYCEDRIVIFHFQYVINTLNLKIFMEHNLSEDIFFVIMAVIGVKSGFSQLIQKREPEKIMEADTLLPVMAVCKEKVSYPKDPFIKTYGLSNRQCDVLYLLLKDKTYLEMGEELGLSVGTVKFHAHGIYEKTDSRNRSELIGKYKEFHKSQEQAPLT
jgi:DNA-binding CsgD family transcriptional regulator